MGKISEILSKIEPVTLEIVGVPVRFSSRFDINVALAFEEQGYTLEQVAKNFEKSKVLWGVKIAWELMTPDSKVDFDHDFNVFKAALVTEDYAAIISMVLSSFTSSMPKAEESKKKTRRERPAEETPAEMSVVPE